MLTCDITPLSINQGKLHRLRCKAFTGADLCRADGEPTGKRFRGRREWIPAKGKRCVSIVSVIFFSPVWPI